MSSDNRYFPFVLAYRRDAVSDIVYTKQESEEICRSVAIQMQRLSGPTAAIFMIEVADHGNDLVHLWHGGQFLRLDTYEFR